MNEKKTIEDSLKIIRDALSDDTLILENKNDQDILLLNKLVKNDGTIELIKDSILEKSEIKEILNQNINNHLNKHFDKWLDKNLPNYLEKYLNKK